MTLWSSVEPTTCEAETAFYDDPRMCDQLGIWLGSGGKFNSVILCEQHRERAELIGTEKGADGRYQRMSGRMPKFTVNKRTGQVFVAVPSDIARAILRMGAEYSHWQLQLDGKITLELLGEPQDAPRDNGVTIDEWLKNA